MNGRAYPGAATAVDRPVLAWNVEPTQFPEMAAAAVSPAVPAAAPAQPPDPYGRCWQSQVDPSACFPYFGTLYGSSLPPPSYRMQPSCLSNLGQFWPPTPPPEGCVRYDGANNLHYCPPLTPVFRHGESLPQNMLGVHQRLGHYSHLIDINKDAGLKRLDPSMDSMQRQKMLKHAKEVPQRPCSCYECNEKNVSRVTTQSVNKENISGSKTSEPKISEDKSRLKSCKRVKDESYSHLRSSSAYHPNSSAISNYSCSVEQSVARMTAAMQGQNPSEYMVQHSQKSDNPVSTNSCVRHDFLRPESNSFPISRCPSNSLMSMTSSKDSTQDVQAMQKRCDHASAEKMSHHKVHVSSGFDSCPCPPVQTSSGSNSHRSMEKSCFSPPYGSSRTLYNNYPENSSHNKAGGMMMIYGNSYNASPFKNVYFSMYESENFDVGSGALSRKGKDSYCKQEKVSNHINSYDNHVMTPSSSQGNYMISSVSNVSPLLNGNTMHHVSHYDTSTVPSDAYGCIYQSSCLEQQKVSDSKYLSSTNVKHNEVAIHPEQTAKMSQVRVKQEKVANSDCKYQKTPHSSSSRIPCPSDAIGNGVLNLSTSLRCPKIEPEDQMDTSGFRIPASSPSVEASSPCKLTQQRSHRSGNDGNSGFCSGVPTPGHLLGYPKVPNPTTPQMHELENDCSAAVPEDLCPHVQMAPPGGAELPSLSKMPSTGHEAPTEVGQSVDLKEESILRKKDENTSVSACFALTQQSQDCQSLFKQVQGNSSIEAFEKKVVSPDDASQSNCSTQETAVPCNISCSAESAMACDEQRSPDAKCSDINECENVDSLVSIKMEDDSMEEEHLGEATISIENGTMPAVASAKMEVVEPLSSVKSEPVDDKDDSDGKPSESDPSENSASNSCHGLYILLQGIAHKKNMDSSGNEQPGEFLNLNPESKVVSPSPVDGVTEAISSKMRGLSLLCALAEEHFFIEFGSGLDLKSELNVEEVSGNVSSNYPAVKEENDSAVPQSAEEIEGKPNTEEINAELKMRQRLAELQLKYREKQKELARLKQKKLKTSSNSETSPSESSSNNIYTPPVACQSTTNCSRGPVGDDTKMPLLKPQSCHAVDSDDSEKQTNSTSKCSSKSSSDEICVFDMPALKAKISSLNRNEKSGRKSRTSSKCSLRHTATRRRAELSRNLRNVSSRSKSSSRYSSRQKARSENSSKSARIAHSESDVSDGVKANSKHQKLFAKLKPNGIEQKDNECNIQKSNSEDLDEQPVQFSMRSPKKRKSENPKRFMPAKQVRLTETIIAKQLRNRILFESPNCSTKKADEKQYDVPEELFDALRKCNLGDVHTQDEKSEVDSSKLPIPEEESNLPPSKGPDGERVLRMTVELLTENKRILALEEGLFYAGTIKEVQSLDVFSIVLDGQRGNKKHLFSKEEMLNQTIIELKPTSLDELPEGTRICAYWSHQYRCLYPGTVVRAPAPSPDWSEPRVYVEFDDGDSAQIAMKNIRFLPQDMQLYEEDGRDSTSDSKTSMSDPSKEVNGRSRKRKTSTRDMRRHSKLCKSELPSSKANTSCSNDGDVEDCTPTVASSSPSHRLEQSSEENLQCGNAISTKVSRRTRRQLSKKRSGSKSKVKEGSSSPEKSKKHKRYKERHKHHHHHRHHHRHHRHCHHHRHCKKRKHHKRASNVDNIINVVIPSSSIPLSNLIAKSTRSSMKDAEAQCVGHSKKDSKQLPQPGPELGDSKTVGASITKEDKAAKESSKEIASSSR